MTALLFLAPVGVFVLVLNWQVGLVPLVGMDMICAKCERKATRTLPSAASALRAKGVYLYDSSSYAIAAPVWCDYHRPDPAGENAGRAYAAAIAAFVIAVFAYKRLVPRTD